MCFDVLPKTLNACGLPNVVGIEKGDHLGARSRDPGVARCGQPGRRLAHKTHPPPIAGDDPRRLIGGAVVYDDDLTERYGLSQNAIECVGYECRSVARRNYHSYLRGPIRGHLSQYCINGWRSYECGSAQVTPLTTSVSLRTMSGERRGSDPRTSGLAQNPIDLYNAASHCC